MGLTAPVMMLMGGGLSAASTIGGGIAANKAAKINGAIEDNQADYIDTRTSSQVAQVRREFGKFRGSQNADAAALGGTTSSGTGLLLAQEAARLAKLDEMNLIVDGSNEASATRMGADMTRYEGRAKQTQAIMGGLGQAFSAGGKYYTSQY